MFRFELVHPAVAVDDIAAQAVVAFGDLADDAAHVGVFRGVGLHRAAEVGAVDQRTLVLEEPQGVLIAGDVYDKTVPSAEAVGMLDDFLVSLSRLGPQVFLISGNHDSPERLAFGGRLMEQSGVHLAPVYIILLCRHEG